MYAVYRMFDRAGKLLYIGKTGHAARFDSHAVKRWFPLVASITLEWHDTEASALLAEAHAIAIERPRYNIAGNRGPKLVRRTPKQKPLEVKPALPSLPVRDGKEMVTLAEAVEQGISKRRLDTLQRASRDDREPEFPAPVFPKRQGVAAKYDAVVLAEYEASR